jgi:hypothetical protein
MLPAFPIGSPSPAQGHGIRIPESDHRSIPGRYLSVVFRPFAGAKTLSHREHDHCPGDSLKVISAKGDNHWVSAQSTGENRQQNRADLSRVRRLLGQGRRQRRQAAVYYAGSNGSDADTYFEQYFRTGGSKRINYSNPEFDRLIDEEQKTGDHKIGGHHPATSRASPDGGCFFSAALGDLRIGQKRNLEMAS